VGESFGDEVQISVDALERRVGLGVFESLGGQQLVQLQDQCFNRGFFGCRVFLKCGNFSDGLGGLRSLELVSCRDGCAGLVAFKPARAFAVALDGRFQQRHRVE